MFHLSVKPISRSGGRSATAAIAYRAAERVVDSRTGEIHDYTRKGGVEHSEIVLGPGAPAWATDREALWNAAESAEKRKDARVAREYEVAIPKDLSRDQGIELVRDFAESLVERYGVAVDFAVHADDRRHWDGTEKGFQGYHAHVLSSTRKLGPSGFGEKAEPELSDTKRKSLGLGDGASEVDRSREIWERLANRHLERAGREQRIDRRSLKDQGVDREPTVHLGPKATELERRGVRTDLGEVNRRIELAWREGRDLRRERAVLDRQILDLSTSLGEALAERDRMLTAAVPAHPPGRPRKGEEGAPGEDIGDGSDDERLRRLAESGKAGFRERFEQHKRELEASRERQRQELLARQQRSIRPERSGPESPAQEDQARHRVRDRGPSR